MKKTIVLLAVAMLYASNTFAAVGATNTDAASMGTTLKGFNPTKNVKTYFQENAEFTTWGAASAHAQGDKEYVTSSAFGGVAFKTVTPGSTNGTTSPTAPATPTDSAVPGASGAYTPM